MKLDLTRKKTNKIHYKRKKQDPQPNRAIAYQAWLGHHSPSYCRLRGRFAMAGSCAQGPELRGSLDVMFIEAAKPKFARLK